MGVQTDKISVLISVFNGEDFTRFCKDYNISNS